MAMAVFSVHLGNGFFWNDGGYEYPLMWGLLALGFVLAHQEVDTAILGTGNPAHMLANIDIVEKRLPLPEEVVEELHRRFDLLGADWRGID